MRVRCLAVVFCLLSWLGCTAAYADATIEGLRRAKLGFQEGRGGAALVSFAEDLELYFLGNPTCSGGDEAQLRLSTSTGSTGSILLPCERWKSRTFSYQYRDREGTAGGVTAVKLGYGRLKIQLKGPGYVALRGPTEFLEISFRVGALVVCGRAMQFQRNDEAVVLALGPTTECFDPIVGPTFTPTRTPSETATPSATPIPPSPTATATATLSATPTSTATATDTATQTPTDTPTDTPTETPTPSSTATPTATATVTPSSTPSATATAEPVFSVDLTAYRPASEGYGAPLARRAVGVAVEDNPGAGIRVNGDDDNANGVADRLDGNGNNENDLIEVVASVSPTTPPAGYEYVLSRSSSDLKVWSASNKGSLVLGSGSDVVVSFSSPTRTFWVECTAAGSGEISLKVRRSHDGSTYVADGVRLFSFTSVVIALGGENQTPSNPINSGHGMFVVGANLYDLGYDVHIYDEDDVGSDGSGPAYNEIVGAIRDRGVQSVAMFGYSHGGGSVHDLASRLDTYRASIGSFVIPYTAYVDGVENDSDIDLDSEVRLPFASQYHANYYQRNFIPMGNHVAGANVNLNLGGDGTQHGDIDDRTDVRTGIQDAVVQRVFR